MKVLKTILVIILGFVLGFMSAIGAIVGTGYYIVTKVTPEQAESTIQSFTPEFSLPEKFPEQLLNKTILEIVREVMDIAGNLNTLTLNQLQERIGYQIPMKLDDGRDISFLFEPIMDIPIMSIPDNMNLVVDNISMNSLMLLGVISAEDLPDLPMFSNEDSLNAPLMSLFSGFDSVRISDVIDLYTGDYYPDDNGEYVLTATEYEDYDKENPDHKGLTVYKESYIKDDQGDYVKVNDQYIAYNEADHSSMQRYNMKMVPCFTGDKVMTNAVFEPYEPANPEHQSLARYKLPEKSPDVLLAIGGAYINKVPESDPSGKTISDTIKVLQVKDIINTEGASNIILALKDAYISDSAPEGGMTIAQTVETLQIKQVIDVYEEDIYEGEVLLHAKSNQVLIAIKDAYIGSNPPAGGLSINDTINTLQVKDIMEVYPDNIYDISGQLIREKSTPMLIAIKDAYVGNTAPEGQYTVTQIVEKLQIKDVINIYDGTEYVLDANGIFTVDGYILYDSLNPDHEGLERFDYITETNEYVAAEEGEWVLRYVSYDPALHEGRHRYSFAAKSSNVLIAIQDAYLGDNPPEGGKTISQTIDTVTLGEIIDINENSSQILKELKDTPINELDSSLNALKLKQTLDIYTEDIFDINGLLVKEKSNTVLINLGEAYIGSVPESDPEGKTISATLDGLTFEQIIDIYDGTEMIKDDLGIYYRIPAVYELFDEENPAHIALKRYRLSDKDWGYYPDAEGSMVMTLSAQFVQDTNQEYIDFMINNPEHPGLPRYKIAQASSTLMESLRTSRMDTIDNDINNLELGKVIKIDAYSSRVLQSLKNTTLNNLNAKIETLLLSEVINIYDGYEYIQAVEGEFVISGYAAFDENNPYHTHLQRYAYDDINDTYIPDENGAFVDNYITYDPIIHAGQTRYTLPAKSPLILRSIKDAPINDMDSTINTLQLKDVINITPNSSKILTALSEVYIGDTAPEGGMTLEQKINVLTLSEIVNVYEKDEYYEDTAGGYVMDYILYDDNNIDHAALPRYQDMGGGVFELNVSGNYVYFYTEYNPVNHDGFTRYGKHAKSSVGLITLKDTNINEIDSTLSTLKLKDVQQVYDGNEFYEKNKGSYIKDGYEAYNPLEPKHSHLTRFSYTGGEYVEDPDGDYVERYRLAIAGDEDHIFPRYALHAPSSKFIRSLADTPLNDLGSKMDTLTIGEMIEITPSSPKILRQFEDSSLNTLENTIFNLQLKDVVDIYEEDVYTEAEGGDYVFYEGAYVPYDELNPEHDGLTRYNKTADKSSHLVIALKDAYLYNTGSGETLEQKLNDLTLIDILGEPAAGTLMFAISYEADGVTPIRIMDIESRTTAVMVEATLEELAGWGVIDASGFDPVKWNSIKGYTIQEFLNQAIVWMP